MSHPIPPFRRTLTVTRLLQSAACVLLSANPCHGQELAQVKNMLAFSARGAVHSTTQAGGGGAGGSQGAGRIVPSGEVIPPASTVSTGKDGATSIILGTTGTARLGADTEIHAPALDEKAQSLELLKGRLYLNISAEELKKRAATEFKLKTPAALLAVKGTKFFAISENGTDTIGVHEGSVSVTEPVSKASVLLEAGQAVTVSSGNLSALRPLAGAEKDFLQQYEATRLLRNSLDSLSKGGTRLETQHLYWNGLSELDGEKPLNRTAALAAQMIPGGIVRYQWTPPLPAERKINFNISARFVLRLKLGSRLDEEPLALMCLVRSRQMVQARLRNITKTSVGSNPYSAGAPYLLQPKKDDDGWMECLMPFPRTADKTSDQDRIKAVKEKAGSWPKDFLLEINIIPMKYARSTLDRPQATAAIELGDFSVVNIPADPVAPKP